MKEKGKDHQKLPPGFDLTSKQRAFAHAYLETGGNGREAALQVYNCSSPESASVLAHKTLNNPKVVAYLNYHFLRHDMPDAVVETLKESLSATKIIKVGGEYLEVPDHTARLKAVDQIAKIMGLYWDPKDETPSEPLSKNDYWMMRFTGAHSRMPRTGKELKTFIDEMEQKEGPFLGDWKLGDWEEEE